MAIGIEKGGNGKILELLSVARTLSGLRPFELVRADGATAQFDSRTARVDVVDPEQYDAVYLVGGHGTMWDFPDSEGLQNLVASVYNAGGLVGAVCHGPAGLLNVELENGLRLVEGRKVAAFANDEEVAAGKDKVIPFFLADRLEE